MPVLVDTSLWIDLTRKSVPAATKVFIADRVSALDACIAEPIVFETLRHATGDESAKLRELFATLPLLPTPPELWEKAVSLGQACRGAGLTVGALDLLIVTIAKRYDAYIVTLDKTLHAMATPCEVQIELLMRPQI